MYLGTVKLGLEAYRKFSASCSWRAKLKRPAAINTRGIEASFHRPQTSFSAKFAP